jgi:hypothetical protein
MPTHGVAAPKPLQNYWCKKSATFAFFFKLANKELKGICKSSRLFTQVI